MARPQFLLVPSSYSSLFGTSRSICMHPPTITHEHMTPDERKAVGIDEGLIRFSVGLENPEDIIADLAQALAKV